MRQRQVYAIAVAIVTTLSGARGSLCARQLPIPQRADTHRVAAGATESQCGAEWQPANEPPREDLHSVAYGNGLYLAAGSHGTLLTSPDGITWTPRTSGTTYQLNGLAYGGGQYVAVDIVGSVLTSPDGITWTARISPLSFSSTSFWSVAYGSGRFVVVGSYIPPFAPFAWTTLTSTDGVSWNQQLGTGFALGGVTYGNGLFVAVGNDKGGPGAIVTSIDGTNWTRRYAGTGQYLGGVAFGGGQFVALGNLGSLLTSTDGFAWTDNTIGPGTFHDITYGAGQFVVVGSGGRILTSPDGTTWTIRTSNTADDLNAVSYGGGLFLAVGAGGVILSSEDAETWTNRAWWNQTLIGVAFGAGAYVAVGEAGTILTSPDGNAWISRTSGTSRKLNAVAFGDDLFVTVGESGTIMTSPDGITWTSRSSATTSDLYGVVYGAGQFVAVGSSLTALTSPDGTTWTIQPGGTTSYAVAWGRDRFAAVGPIGQIKSSVDGRTWMYWSSGVRDELYGVAYGAGVYVAVGAEGSITTSEDGSAWTVRVSGTNVSPLIAVAFGGGQFIAVGCGGSLKSSDGITWTSTPAGVGVTCSNAIVYGAGQFLAAGGSGRIARSACATTAETLSVAMAGPGRGRVTSSPAGISCGTTCSWNFELGTEISLFPIPDAGFAFLEWQGDCTGAATCHVVMNRARTVSAVFGTPTAPEISTVSPVGAGTSNAASVPSHAGSSYQWTIQNGTITSGQGSSQIIFTAGAAGTLTVSVVEVINSGWISPPGMVEVSVIDRPLSLSQSRVRVTVEWQNPYSSERGVAYPIPQSDQFGFFYYTDPNNPEVFVKVLDFGTGSALCFVGGLTDFYYKVTFKTVRTGQTLVFEKPAYQYVGFVDNSTLKFAGTPGMTFVGVLETRESTEMSTTSETRNVVTPTPLAAAPQSLELSAGRISVTVDWRNPYSGETGRAYGIPKADQFGFFYYTDPNNPEVFGKVLDFGAGSALVFVGGLTDFYYKVTFTVLRTGQQLVFEKPEYQYLGFVDNSTLKF
ncbi:MAG: hypothetical protein ACHQPI_05610 [Thermoanaerobaculia bacterium]